MNPIPDLMIHLSILSKILYRDSDTWQLQAQDLSYSHIHGSLSASSFILIICDTLKSPLSYFISKGM